MKASSQPSVLLCAAVWWPLSARLAMAFVHHGCRVTAVCPPGHPLHCVSGVQSIHTSHGLGSTALLRAAIRAENPTILVPCDDGAVWQLYELYKHAPELRELIEFSLGNPEAYSILQRRSDVLKVAEELGIRVPCTKDMATLEDLDSWRLEWPAVLKVDGTWGGEGVAIVRSLSEARRAYHSVFGARRAGRAWKRYLINRHPIALWSWRRRKEASISLQEFIPGRPATTMFACWKGEVLASVTVEVLASQGPTGAATIVRRLQHEEIENAARLLARKFTLSGFHGLDFVLDAETRAAYLIEMNPRATQLGHLDLTPHGDLAGILSSKLQDDSLPLPVPGNRITHETIAFFPQAWNSNPKSPYLVKGYHDVPWEEPALVRDLVGGSWPERRLLNRLLNLFRTRKQVVHSHGVFEAIETNLS